MRFWGKKERSDGETVNTIQPKHSATNITELTDFTTLRVFLNLFSRVSLPISSTCGDFNPVGHSIPFNKLT